MSSPKLVTIYGLLGKIEATYGAGATMSTATDGILLSEAAAAQISWAHDGSHPFGAGTLGQLKPGVPGGRSIDLPVKVRARGAGAAYSASVLPDGQALYRASGHGATIVTTGGSESVTYAPVSTAFASAALSCYGRGQLWPVIGAYADFGFDLEAGGFCILDFPVKGLISADPTDVAVPTITYPAVIHPTAMGLAVTIGALTAAKARVRRITFKRGGGDPSPRLDANSSFAAGHAGFSPTGRRPELEILMEATALTDYNPYADQVAGTLRAITFTLGATQYNKLVFTAPYCYLMEIGEEDDGTSALWRLKYLCAVSTPNVNDDYTIGYT